MAVQHQSSTSICPYCERPVTLFSGGMDCPHCAQQIISVACPKCARPTLNLTLIPRYGKAVCFACRSEYDHVPGAHQEILPSRPVAPTPPPAESTLLSAITPRAPKIPTMPSAGEARAIIEQCLVGLERASLDRELLRAPDLRAVINQFLDIVQAALALDTAMENGDVTEAWLRDPEHLDLVVRLCFAPLWPSEGMLLPATVQAWGFAVDDAARRWQHARRCWLAEAHGLTMMPAVPGMTTVTSAWHDVIGDAPVISEVLLPGFLLGGTVIRKARVLAEPEL